MKIKKYNNITLDNFEFFSDNVSISKEDSDAGLIRSNKYTWYDNNGKLVAKVSVEWWPNNWVSCYDLEVTESYRGMGLGHQLVEFIKSLGVNNLSVDPENSIAIDLYSKHGFYITGELDGKLLRMKLYNGV